MKRASLAVVPSTQKDAAPDLTDRILARTTGTPPRLKPARPPRITRNSGSETRASTSFVRAAKLTPPSSAPAEAPAPAPSELTSSTAAGTGSLDQALAQTNQAVEALAQAAQASPARYEVGLRYRLDSLAHHLRQVAEYIDSAGRK